MRQQKCIWFTLDLLGIGSVKPGIPCFYLLWPLFWGWNCSLLAYIEPEREVNVRIFWYDFSDAGPLFCSKLLFLFQSFSFGGLYKILILLALLKRLQLLLSQLNYSVLSWFAVSLNGTCGYESDCIYLQPYFKLNSWCISRFIQIFRLSTLVYLI